MREGDFESATAALGHISRGRISCVCMCVRDDDDDYDYDDDDDTKQSAGENRNKSARRPALMHDAEREIEDAYVHTQSIFMR